MLTYSVIRARLLMVVTRWRGVWHLYNYIPGMKSERSRCGSVPQTRVQILQKVDFFISCSFHYTI